MSRFEIFTALTIESIQGILMTFIPLAIVCLAIHFARRILFWFKVRHYKQNIYFVDEMPNPPAVYYLDIHSVKDQYGEIYGWAQFRCTGVSPHYRTPLVLLGQN